MADEGIVLTDEDFCRVSRATLAYEAMPSSVEETNYLDTGNDGNWDDWVKVTGAVSGGWYPGIRQRYTESTNTWADVTGATCYIRGPNGETLTNGSRYRGNIVDKHSGASAYQAIGYDAAAAAGLTVQEVDGTPSVSSVTTINFDQADGFTVTNSGGGVARIDMVAASHTLVGVVNLVSQYLGAGTKTVDDLIIPAIAGLVSGANDVLLTSASLGGSGLLARNSNNTYDLFNALRVGSGGGPNIVLAGDADTTFLTAGYIYSGKAFVIGNSPGSGIIGVTETTPAGKQPIFQGGICIGHTP